MMAQNLTYGPVHDLTSDPKSWANIYTHFANDNINVLNASVSDGKTIIVLEYSIERQRDGKLIWPKIAVEASTLAIALMDAQDLIEEIRNK